MALDAKIEARMNQFAKLARIEFEKNFRKWKSPDDVARWWNKWCDFDKTNHDRLGWILWHVTGVRTWNGDRNKKPFLYD